MSGRVILSIVKVGSCMVCRNRRLNGWIMDTLKFESDSITERDLRRFREYEAYIGMIYKVTAATLVLCTSMEISERICRGMDILESPGLDMKEEDVKRMQSVQYALAVKFLDRNQLMDVKEKIGMTILGQMLFEDGEKKGMERGVE